MKKEWLITFLIVALIIGARNYYLYANYAYIENSYGVKYNIPIDSETVTLEGNEISEVVICSDELSRLTKLTKLRVWAKKDFDLNCISGMNDLADLTVFCSSDCGGLETLPELPKLNYLFLEGDPEEKSSFYLSDENEYHFSGIEDLIIDWFENVDLNSLSHFKNVRKLYISVQNPDMSGIEALGDMEKLEYFRLKSYFKQSDILRLSGLKNCKSLKRLSVSNLYEKERFGEMVSLDDTACFSELSSVAELHLGCIEIKNVDGLLEMKSLEHLSVNAGCISEENIEKLENAGIQVEVLEQ